MLEIKKYVNLPINSRVLIIVSTRNIKELWLVALFLLVFPLFSSAQEMIKGEREGSALVDRFAVRTNVLDWALTIPNIGFEFDLSGSEYNNMTLGLSAKYNWETSHTYAPAIVFNLFDVRPEFRYWYRTRKPVKGASKWDLQTILKDRKNPRSWRAHYIGAYVNYASYSFKFSERGIQGNTLFGLGASVGYNIPMYEYKSGVVDVELGFSVGLQVCDKQYFIHNHDTENYSYTKIDAPGSRDKVGFTPFPVVSDLRLAFVWRHKSIKDKVKEDEDRNRVVRHYNRIEGDHNFNDFTYESHNITLENTISNSRQRKAIMENDSLYRAGFVAELDKHEEKLLSDIPRAFPDDFKMDPRVHEIVKKYEQKLVHLVHKRKKKALSDFEAEWGKVKSVRDKEAKAAAKAVAKEEAKEKAEKTVKEKGQDDQKVKQSKDSKDSKEPKETKEAKEPKQPKQPKEPKEQQQKQQKQEKQGK